MVVGPVRRETPDWSLDLVEQTGVDRAEFDVTSDGQRFLMIQEGQQDSLAPLQINVVLNWFEELKQRVPTGQ